MTSTARLRLTLLGGFQGRVEGGPPLVLPTKKTQALLAYLALPLGQSHPREKLAGLLWGDMRDTEARANLRHALSRIGKALPKTARAGLLLQGGSVALQPAMVDVDVTAFERLVAEGSAAALAQAAETYRGGLLAGLTLDERPFEEWLTTERERLHELAIQALGRLLRHQRAAGEDEPAVQTALRLLALDPLQEPVHRLVMRLYARLGRREAALRQHQLCVDLLRRELQAQPEPETTQLYREILGSRARARDRSAESAREAGETPGRLAPDPVPPADREPRAAATGAEPAPVATAPLTNLSAPTAELIGREVSLAEVRDLVRAHRLVTLVGAGGIGKTRLGLEAGRHLVRDFDDGVWVAELAPLPDPEFVAAAVGAACGLTLPAGASALDQIAAAIGTRHLLLVLDNCEHVIDAAARVAEAVLRVDARAHVVATSREPLHVPGEYVYRVPPLQVPAESTDRLEHVIQAGAVKLFLARAQAVDARLQVDARTAAMAAAVCRRLDGIPLAIELAAARTATLGVEALAARLDDRFRLLTGGHRTALPRHQTLRATLDWSYELLPGIERTVLSRLAVFARGFTLEAASAVIASAEITAHEVLDAVTNLVEKSLVGVEIEGGRAWYRLLETTRAYALDKLAASGETEPVARRHAEYCRDLFERAEAEWETRPAQEWLAAYGRQIDNGRAALDWAFSPRGDASIGAALTAALLPLWFQQSLMVECRGRIERALAGVDVGPDRGGRREMQLYAALGAALMQTKGPAPDTTAAWTTAFQIAERLEDTEYQLRALWGLWHFRVSRGECRAALELAERFCALVATTADPTEALIGQRMVGVSLHYLGDQAGARQHLESMLSRYVRPAHRSHAIRFQYDQRVASRMILARILWLQGLPDTALRMALDNVEEARTIDHALSLCYALEAACLVSLFAGDRSAAARSVADLLEHSGRHALTVWHARARCLDGVRLIVAARTADGVVALRAAMGELRETGFAPYYTGFLAALAEGLGRVGEVAQGLAAIDEAIARSERDEERWCAAELLRVKAELVLQGDVERGAAAAEAHFAEALRWAREQGALSWELRTATGLARLWNRQGRIAAARDVLAPVYARLTEGFDRPDAQAARMLLGALG